MLLWCITVWLLELIFFLVALVALWFELMMKAAMVIHPWLSCYRAVLTASSPFQLLCQWGSWGYTRSWKGPQPGQLTQSDQRDVTFHIVSCSTIKCGVVRVADAWGLAGHWTTGGEQLCFLLLTCAFIYYLLNCLSQPTSSCTFVFLILSSIFLQGLTELCATELPAAVKPQPQQLAL